jgi:hypothetical protein
MPLEEGIINQEIPVFEEGKTLIFVGAGMGQKRLSSRLGRAYGGKLSLSDKSKAAMD